MANDITQTIINAKRMKVRLVCKHDTEANWIRAINFKPEKGELIIYDIDDNHSYERMKIGDGKTLVSNLPFEGNDKASLTASNAFSGDNMFLKKITVSADNEGSGLGVATVIDSNKVLFCPIPASGANRYMSSEEVSAKIKLFVTAKSGNDTDKIYFPDKAGTLALTSDIDITAAGNNTFTGTNVFTNNTLEINDGKDKIDDNGKAVIFSSTSMKIYDGAAGRNYTINFPTFEKGDGSTLATLTDLAGLESGISAFGDNNFTGSNTFNNGRFKVNSSYGVEALSIDPLNAGGTGHTGMTTLTSAIDKYCFIELGAGVLSISSKGANTSTGHININTGTSGVDFNIGNTTSALKILSDGLTVNSKTKYCGNKIENIVSGTTYALTLPSKSGTVALTNDVSNYVQANPAAVTSVLTSIKIGNISYGIGGGVSLSGNNTWTGSNTFNNINIASGKINSQNTELSLPTASGTLALTSDLPIKTAALSGNTLSITLNSTNGDASTSTNSVY